MDFQYETNQPRRPKPTNYPTCVCDCRMVCFEILEREMSFDEIPEDKAEAYPCEACGVGSLKLNESKTAFECDTCNAYHEIQVKD